MVKQKNLETSKRIINLILISICFALVISVFAYHWFVHFQNIVVEDLSNFFRLGHVAEISFYGILLVMFSYTYGAVRFGYQKNSELVFSQIFSMLIADVILYIELSIMSMKLLKDYNFLIMVGEQILIVFIYINLVNKFYHSMFPPRKILVIYEGKQIDELDEKFIKRNDKYIISKTVQINGKGEDPCSIIKRSIESDECNAVLIGDISFEKRCEIMKFCYGNSIRLYLIPKITDIICSNAEDLHVFDTPLFLTREYSMTLEQRIVKRMMDIIVSSVMIVITLPITLITAISIKLYDGGPVFYRQERYTKDMKIFNILKFRSMSTHSMDNGPQISTVNDVRITPVGKVIRALHIDELPQFFNILHGEMSVVGPRPEWKPVVDKYMEKLPEFAYRTKVKAGLTGYAQVKGKYNTTPYDKLKLDMMYIENYSLMMDIKILLLTFKVIFMRENSEGVEEGQLSALRDDTRDKDK